MFFGLAVVEFQDLVLKIQMNQLLNLLARTRKFDVEAEFWICYGFWFESREALHFMCKIKTNQFLKYNSEEIRP